MKLNSAVNQLEAKGSRKWFVVANRIEAVIYIEGKDYQFHFINRLDNPKGKQTETELDSDRPGRAFSSSPVFHHSLDRHFQKHEQMAVRFAARIGKHLISAAQKDMFDEVVLVAEPHFLGLLREHLPQKVLQKRIQTIDREYAQGSANEIRKKIFDALSPSASH